MKILLINPGIPVFKRIPSVPLGLLSIASYLNAHGHEAIIIERSVKKDGIKKSINDFKPDIIGISAMSFESSADAKKVTFLIRKLTKAPIVWGGQAASAMPELIFKEAHPDYIIYGEGELTWKAFADAFQEGKSPESLDGIIYEKSGKTVKNPPRPVADLTEFPDIDWSLIEPQKYFSSFFNCSKMLYLYASKGCPGNCTFCSNKFFHQGINRCRAPEQVVRDIEYLSKNFGMNGVYFSDELWCPDREIRTRLCNLLIEKNTGVIWGCQMRLGVLNENDIKLMYKAGCRWILFGIESGNMERIKKIKKGIDLSVAKETIRICEETGITVQASFIIGFPGEDCEEIKQTVKFADSLNASLVLMNILGPLPNSEILRETEKNGTFKYFDSIRKNAGIEQRISDDVIVNLSKVSNTELKVIHYTYQWNCFSSKDSVNDDSFGIIKKMAKDTLKRIFCHGIRGFIFGTFVSAKQFITVFYYSHFFGKIKKKYNI